MLFYFRFYRNMIADFQISLVGGAFAITGKKRKIEMEQRKYPRVETCNLISYLLIRANGEITEQGMGRALNISQGGILLETPQLVLSEHISLMSVDSDNNLIEIKGNIVYSKGNGSGMIVNGVRFQGNHGEIIQFAAKLIKVFHIRKHKFNAAMSV